MMFLLGWGLLIGRAFLAGATWIYVVIVIGILSVFTYPNSLVRWVACLLSLSAIALQAIQNHYTVVTFYENGSVRSTDHNIFVDIVTYTVRISLCTYSLVMAIILQFREGSQGRLRVALYGLVFCVNILSAIGAAMAMFGIYHALNSTTGGWIMTGVSSIAMYDDMRDALEWGWTRGENLWSRVIRRNPATVGDEQTEQIELDVI